MAKSLIVDHYQFYIALPCLDIFNSYKVAIKYCKYNNETTFNFVYNSLATDALVGPGGWVDTVMQIGRQGMFNIIRKKWSQWHLKENGNILKDFKRRGVDKAGVLPNYHYREDATLLWNAIEKYVSRVVDGVYSKLMRQLSTCSKISK